MNTELGHYLIVVVVDQLLLNEVNYRDDLARLMRKLILLSEVAQLSTRLSSSESARNIVDRSGAYEAVFSKEYDVESEAVPETSGSFDYSEAPESVTPGKGYDRERESHFRSSEQIAIANLLDEWEEPELQGYQGEVSVHIVKLPDFMDVAQSSYIFLRAFPCRMSRWHRFCNLEGHFNSSVTTFHFPKRLAVRVQETNVFNPLKLCLSASWSTQRTMRLLISKRFVWLQSVPMGI
jgi:hypothetical protein